MKSLALAALLALALALVAPASADPVKMSVEKASLLMATLRSSLNGTKDRPYKFSSLTSYALARDAGLLEPALKAYDAALKAKTDEVAKAHPEDVAKTPGGAPFVKGSPGDIKLADEMQSLWESEQSFDLTLVHVGDLNIGVDPDKQNQIPPSVLIALTPILLP